MLSGRESALVAVLALLVSPAASSRVSLGACMLPVDKVTSPETFLTLFHSGCKFVIIWNIHCRSRQTSKRGERMFDCHQF